MKILFLVPNPEGTIPGQRFRFEQFLPYLRSRGVRCRVRPFVSRRFHTILYKKGRLAEKAFFTVLGYLYRAWNMLEALGSDAVYIYREASPLGPPVFERLLRLMRKPVVFDFDDSIYLPARSEANKLAAALKRPGKIREIIRMSALVLPGNRNLGEYSREVNANVRVIPTVIDTAAYTPGNGRGNGGICIGWSGSFSTIAHLDTIRDVLGEIGRRFPVILKVIGSKEYSVDGIRVDAQDWRRETEVEDLRAIDIGIMPLPDDEWSRGKCGLKALQYMALGIPTVCSPVGVNCEIIRDGVNGFLCRGRDEWISRLSALIADGGLRTRLGDEGRKTVEERYSVDKVAPAFYALISGVCR